MLCLFVRHPLLGLCVDRSVKSHSQYHMRHILRCVDAFKIVCFDQSKVRPTCANSMKNVNCRWQDLRNAQSEYQEVPQGFVPWEISFCTFLQPVLMSSVGKEQSVLSCVGWTVNEVCETWHNTCCLAKYKDVCSLGFKLSVCPSGWHKSCICDFLM